MHPLKILVIDDEQLIRWSFEKNLAAQGYKVQTAESGEEGLRLFEASNPDIVFVDNKLPKIQGLEVISKIKSIHDDTVIVFMTAYGSIDTAVKAMKLGASEYVTKPFTFKEIFALLDGIKSKISLSNEIQLLRRQQKEKTTFDHIIGQSLLMRGIIQDARKIAHIDTTTILLLGESGTGKDLFAKAIHNESSRSGMPFVTINCSTLAETLLESELFGHEQGAFTDAKKLKKGLFEMAEGGTVFLDEIGEINQMTQVKLLGVIENRTIKRLGGTTDIPIDIRIIAATNKDLQQSIREKTFREDLFYRLKVFQIIMPPLRERREDIEVITDHFIKFFRTKFKKHINQVDPVAKELLRNYDWPGNIRELRNVIERAIILESGDTLKAEDLPGEIAYPIGSMKGQPGVKETLSTGSSTQPGHTGISLYEQEKNTIIQILESAKNNQTKAAKLLGISRDTLRYKIKKYKI